MPLLHSVIDRCCLAAVWKCKEGTAALRFVFHMQRKWWLSATVNDRHPRVLAQHSQRLRREGGRRKASDQLAKHIVTNHIKVKKQLKLKKIAALISFISCFSTERKNELSYASAKNNNNNNNRAAHEMGTALTVWVEFLLKITKVLSIVVEKAVVGSPLVSLLIFQGQPVKSYSEVSSPEK